MICTWSSWCHCHPIISCFIKIQTVFNLSNADLPRLSWKRGRYWWWFCGVDGQVLQQRGSRRWWAHLTHHHLSCLVSASLALFNILHMSSPLSVHQQGRTVVCQLIVHCRGLRLCVLTDYTVMWPEKRKLWECKSMGGNLRTLQKIYAKICFGLLVKVVRTTCTKLKLCLFGICAEELLASVKFCFAVAVLYFIKSTDFGASWYWKGWNVSFIHPILSASSFCIFARLPMSWCLSAFSGNLSIL